MSGSTRANPLAESIARGDHLFTYEDNRGVFDEADGRQLLKYLTALRFRAVRWEIVPGTTYERAILLEVDTTTPEYRAFEKQLYTQALCDLGFQSLLTPEREQQKGIRKGKERKVLRDRTET